MRKGPWKVHFRTTKLIPDGTSEVHDPPLLYNIETDPSEQYNVGGEHPDIIMDLVREADNHSEDLIRGEEQTTQVKEKFKYLFE
ncbi:MAG: hypothetical protein WDZ53_02235 [Balneolales bacterium]